MRTALDAVARVTVPLGKFTAPEEIARQIGFLLSDLAALITGTVLVSDGRYSI
jgi:NAD(P)-dependent dehydrogenase (short-subunit alcohol dehydrogenase family)